METVLRVPVFIERHARRSVRSVRVGCGSSYSRGILLLERDTIPRAEQALKYLEWDSDDDYYGKEACDALREWAERDWKEAEEAERKEMAKEQASSNPPEKEAGPRASTTRPATTTPGPRR